MAPPPCYIVSMVDAFELTDPPPAPPGPVKLTDLDRTTDPGLDDIRGAA